MRVTLASTLCVLVLASGVIGATEGEAHAYHWASKSLSTETILAPSLALGSNVVTIAPYYNTGYSYSILTRTESGTSQNYEVDTYDYDGCCGHSWSLQTGDYLAGLDLSTTGGELFGWSHAGKATYQASLPNGTWHINIWGGATKYTSLAAYSSTDIFLTKSNDTSCVSGDAAGAPYGPCIYYTNSLTTTPTQWAGGFGAEQVVFDQIAAKIYALDSSNKVWSFYELVGEKKKKTKKIKDNKEKSKK